MSRSSTATPRSRPSRESWRDAAFGPWGSSSMSPTMRPCARRPTASTPRSVALTTSSTRSPSVRASTASRSGTWSRPTGRACSRSTSSARYTSPTPSPRPWSGAVEHAAVPGVGCRTNRIADRPALQRVEGCPHQLRPVRREDLAPFGVRVNALCPGMVKTDLNRAVWEAWARRRPEAERRSYEEWADDKLRRTTPLGRWQQPEDVAAMAVFLASARARNVTGQTVNVDGGFVMRG